MKKYTSVDEYINDFDGVTKERLKEMHKIIMDQVPNAEARISYNIPAYFVNNKMFIYYAGYAKHIGMYPGRTKSEAYNKLAKQYAHGKSTARFDHSEPLPKDVITSFIKVRLTEIGEK